MPQKVLERHFPKNRFFIEKRRRVQLFIELFYVVVRGFEPRQTEPKPVVLPLHHTTIIHPFRDSTAKVGIFLFSYKQIVVLFSSLQYYISVINQICFGKWTRMVVCFLFVYGNTTTLHHLSCFAL